MVEVMKRQAEICPMEESRRLRSPQGETYYNQRIQASSKRCNVEFVKECRERQKI